MTNSKNSSDNENISITLSKDKVIKFCVIIAIVFLVGFSGLVSFTSCGKIKVGGKNICEYQRLFSEESDDKIIKDALGYVGKFGKHGIALNETLKDFAVNSPDTEIKVSALKAMHAINGNAGEEMAKEMLVDKYNELGPWGRSIIFNLYYKEDIKKAIVEAVYKSWKPKIDMITQNGERMGGLQFTIPGEITDITEEREGSPAIISMRFEPKLSISNGYVGESRNFGGPTKFKLEVYGLPEKIEIKKIEAVNLRKDLLKHEDFY